MRKNFEELYDYHLRIYMSSLWNGLIITCLCVLISQLIEYINLDIVNSGFLFLQGRWDKNFAYIIKNIIVPNAVVWPTIFIFKHLASKTKNIINFQYLQMISINIIITTYVFAHNGFLYFSIIYCLSIFLCVPYDIKVKSVSFILCVILSIVYMFYQMSSMNFVDYLYHFYILTITLCCMTLSFSISTSVHKVFNAVIDSNFDLYKKAIIDPLTLLYNKSTLDKNIEKGDWLSICFIDIDNFKDVNDNYGHSFGDEVLSNIGKLLKEVENSKAFRFGGDEFILLSKNNPTELSVQMTKLKDDFSNNFSKKNITCSIGIGAFEKNKGLALADASMYKAKQRGKNSIFVLEDD